MFWNVQSILNKIDSIRIEIARTKPEVLCLSETWIQSPIPNNLIAIEGYAIYRLDRQSKMCGKQKRGGGLLIYTAHNTNCSSIVDVSPDLEISSPDIELAAVKLSLTNTRPIYVLSLYRPQSGNVQNRIDHIDNALNSLDKGKPHDIFLGGDFNINFGSSSPAKSKLQELAKHHSLSQLIKSPTRFSATSSTIDLILSNSEIVSESGSLPINISDHLPIFALRKRNRMEKHNVTSRGRSYRNYEPEQFKHNLRSKDWTEFWNCHDANRCWEIMYEYTKDQINLVCPEKNFKFSDTKPPWYNNELIELAKDRDHAIRVAQRDTTAESKRLARQLRNQANTCIRQAKQEYIKELLKRDKKDPAKFWKDIKELMPETKHSPIVLETDQNVEVPHDQVPNYINSFVANIAKTLADKLPNQQYQATVNQPSMTPIFNLNLITAPELLLEIKAIPIHKSSGIPGISARVWKDCFNALSDKLLHIFNLSILTHMFPQDWKKQSLYPSPRKPTQNQ